MWKKSSYNELINQIKKIYTDEIFCLEMMNKEEDKGLSTKTSFIGKYEEFSWFFGLINKLLYEIKLLIETRHIVLAHMISTRPVWLTPQLGASCSVTILSSGYMTNVMFLLANDTCSFHGCNCIVQKWTSFPNPEQTSVSQQKSNLESKYKYMKPSIIQPWTVWDPLNNY